MRRVKGTGSIIRLSSGKYQARISIDGRIVSHNCGTKKEASEWLKKKKSSKVEDEHLFKDAAVKYLESRKVGMDALAEQSWNRLESTLRIHVIPTWGYTDVNKMDAEIIERWLMSYSIGRSRSTMKKIKDAIAQVLKYCGIKMEIALPRTRGTKTVPIYSKSQVHAMIDEMDSGRYKYGRALKLILFTGLRAGEMCALTREDITEDGIKVTKTVVMLDGVPRVQMHPKSEASIRVIPIGEKAREIISEMDDEGLLIKTAAGGIVPPTALNRCLVKVMSAAGVPKHKGCGVHVLRDIYATYLYSASRDLLVVSKILGHSSTRVTEKYYVAVMEQRKKDAVELLQF